LSRSSVETIRARVGQDAGFKNCCTQSGKFDGTPRDHFFQRLEHWQLVGRCGERIGLTSCHESNLGIYTNGKADRRG
jgi:hypothetical protein